MYYFAIHLNLILQHNHKPYKYKILENLNNLFQVNAFSLGQISRQCFFIQSLIRK